MPTVRNRSFTDQVAISGTRYHRTFGLSTRSRTIGPYGSSEDVVGNRPNANNLKIIRSSKDTFVLDGEYSDSSGILLKYEQAPIQYDPPIPTSPFAAVPTALQLAGWRTEVLARTNVNVAGTNVPQFVAEFGDYAGLIRSTQQLWAEAFRLAALGYITWRWVVRPFMADLESIAKFADNASKRTAELVTLRDRGFRRQRVALAVGRHVSVGSVELIESQDFLMYAKRYTHSQSRVWGSVQWNLAPGVKLPPTLEGIQEFAHAIEVGFTSYNAIRTLWELCPWSWFIDWFVKVGEFIDAHDGTVPCTSSNCCVMRQLSSHSRWTVTTPPPAWVTYSGNLNTRRTEKQRFVVSGAAVPNLGFPFFRPENHAILGALAVVKEPSLVLNGNLVRENVGRFLRDSSSGATAGAFDRFGFVTGKSNSSRGPDRGLQRLRKFLSSPSLLKRPRS